MFNLSEGLGYHSQGKNIRKLEMSFIFALNLI
mgnify:CR=1 FL=1